MSGGLILAVPPLIINLVQSGLLERGFHDSLFPALLFRNEAQKGNWEGHTGVELLMTRPGTLAPIVKPMRAGQDPQSQVLSYEQWYARLDRFSGSIDTYMPMSAVSNSDQFLLNVKQLGMQAGQSINRLPRNELYSKYLSGHTTLIVAASSGDLAIRVASVNGFTDVVAKGTVSRPMPVSASSPLEITIMNGTTPIVRNVIAVELDNPEDPLGPGTLVLSAAVGASVAVRAPVLAFNRPRVQRSGGGLSVDAIGSSDIFQLQDVWQAVSALRRNNVPPHEDGKYHVHINTDANNQLFSDPAWQRLHQGTAGQNEQYQDFFIGTIGQCSFFQNNECPDSLNSGARTATSANAAYSEEIGAETTNDSGVNIGRILVTGRGALYERVFDESSYVSEAGLAGQIKDFQVVNAGMEIKTEDIRLILRAPINKTQDVVSATWSITTSFSTPSDITAGGNERYKRALVIEHALDS